MKLIYVADDDKNICKLLTNHIESAGYKVVSFSDGKNLLDAFNNKPCDLIITDIMMPNMNGYDLCKEIRKTSMIPIFMISANNDEIDRVLGLELGSDDYISKPISFRELITKIKNTFKRIEMYQNASVGVQNDKVLVCNDLSVDQDKRAVFIMDEMLKTTAKEFELLELFLSNQTKAFSREMIIERIWGYEYFGDSRQVDHMIKRLRKKMIEAGCKCKIETVWGFGYKLGGENEE